MAKRPATRRRVVQAKTWAPTSNGGQALRREPEEPLGALKGLLRLMRRRRRAGRTPQMKVAPMVRRTERARTVKLTEMVWVRGMASWGIRRAMDGEEGKSDAEDAAGEGEKQDFGEGGLQDVGGGGSEGGADGGFAVAADESGELSVGEIDAGDEEDAEDGGHEKPEAGGGFADEDFLHGLDVGGEGALRGAVELARGNLAGEGVVEGVEVFLGLGDGDAGLEAAEGDVVAVVAVEAELLVGSIARGVRISLSGS